MPHKHEMLTRFVDALQMRGATEISEVSRSETSLAQLYMRLPGRFPRLFEQFLISYAWSEMELEWLRLLPNSTSADLTEFSNEVFKDKRSADILIAGGFLQFGRGRDISYDPVCFDTRRQRHGGDCPVVQIDHEEVICRSRIHIVSELAPSFGDLVLRITALEQEE